MKDTREVWYYDIEAVNWDVVICIVAISARGEVMRWFNEDWNEQSATARSGSTHTLRQARAFFDRHAKVVWAHAGGLYDHLLMWSVTDPPHEVILTGSSVMLAKTRNANGQELKWRDTMPRWLCSLEKVGKALGKPKGDLDRSRLHTYHAHEILAYCEQDVAILRAGSLLEDQWLASYGVKANTSGSAAVELLRVMDPETWMALARNPVPRSVLCGKEPYTPEWDEDPCSDLKADFRPPPLSLVTGGRTETRRIGHVTGPIHVYDIHSSYPSQYSYAPLWVGCVPDRSTDLDAEGWIDLVQWEQHPLPGYTAPELGIGGFGCGTLTARMHWELAQWLDGQTSLGVRNVRRLGVGYRGSEKVTGFGAAFVRTLFDLKDAASRPDADAVKRRLSFFAKVTVNSLHGRFGINPDREKHVLPEDFKRPLMTPDGERIGWDPSWYQEEPTLLPASPSQQPILAAAILGRGRLQWARTALALEKAGHSVLYGDTDSIMTHATPDQFVDATWHAGARGFGPALGQWGHEGEYESATILAPKVYVLHGKGDVKPKLTAKGMPVRETREDGTPVMTPDTYARALVDPDGVPLTRTGLGRFRSGHMGERQELTRTLAYGAHGRKLTFTLDEVPNGDVPLEYLSQEGEAEAFKRWERSVKRSMEGR